MHAYYIGDRVPNGNLIKKCSTGTTAIAIPELWPEVVRTIEAMEAGKEHMCGYKDLPMLEFRLLFGFANVTCEKNNFSCIKPRIVIRTPINILPKHSKLWGKMRGNSRNNIISSYKQSAYHLAVQETCIFTPKYLCDKFSTNFEYMSHNCQCLIARWSKNQI